MSVITLKKLDQILDEVLESDIPDDAYRVIEEIKWRIAKED